MTDSPKSILIVDDSKINRIVMGSILGDGYHILEAENGAEALDILRREKEHIAVMVLDLNMPEKDGYAVLEEIQSDFDITDTPVVVVTSIDEVDSEVRVLELGAWDFIPKPFDPRVIKHRVNNIIAQKEFAAMRLENMLLKEQGESKLREWTMLNNVPGGIAIFEISEPIRTLFANVGFFTMLGYDYYTDKGDHTDDSSQYIYSDDMPELIRVVQQAVIDGDNFSHTVRIRRQDGSYMWIMIHGRPIDYDSEFPVFLTMMLDVSKEKEIERELEYRAQYDQLTGIYNKETFYRHTREMLLGDPDTRYVLVRCNVERFKLINDLFGVRTGDRILQWIAHSFEDTMPGVGSYGRLEADHFAICFPAAKLDLTHFTQEVERRCREQFPGYNLIVSFGLYEIDDINIPVSQMCDRANLALQTIKGNYLRHYAFYDDALRDDLLREQEIISEANEALAQRQFTIYLQPVYSLAGQELVSAEALVRWIHPQKGVLKPNLFIPLFERNGFIAKLDYYVWEETCKYLQQRKKERKKPLPISVNISRRSLYDPQLADKIIALVQQYKLDPALLKLEITESAYTDNPEQLLHTMQILQSHGFVILMDDFGSGYSSLNMLKDVPADILKIDMAFLGGFESSTRAGNILTSVVRMAKWLGMPIIAEGVETAVQAGFLRSIGCDRIQGYYFSPPLPIDDFEKLLRRKTEISTQPLPLAPDDDTTFDVLFNGNLLISRLLTSVIGGIAFYELNGDHLDVLRVNDGYYDLLGYDPQSFYVDSANVIAQVLEEDRPRLLAACRRATANQSTENILFRRYHHDGHLLWLDVNISYLGGEEARPLLCLAFNDVTAQKLNEEELAQKNAHLERHHHFLEALYQAVPYGIAHFTAEDHPRLVDYNTACWKIFGYADPAGFEQAMSGDVMDVIHPDDRRDMVRIFRQRFNSTEAMRYDTRFIRADGSIGHASCMLGLVETPDGELLFQNLFRDMSVEKDLELELELELERRANGGNDC